MLDNYEKLSNGVIKQINVTKINYDFEYANKYNSYGEKGNYLSFLRLGVLMGAIGHTPSSLVDVGYGNGSFLKACLQTIPRLYGCDVSNYPLPESCRSIAFKDISNVDVVCFFDSLEHFDNIYDIKLLSTKYIFISVPWCHYISDEWFEKWYHRRENEHLYHFSDISIKNFFKECGYDCIYQSSFEDTIRKNTSVGELPNILSCVFKKVIE